MRLKITGTTGITVAVSTRAGPTVSTTKSFNDYMFAGGAPNDKKLTSKERTTERLGVAGLALHYANIINQIDSLVCSLFFAEF